MTAQVSPAILEELLVQKHRGCLGPSPIMWEERGKIWKRKKISFHTKEGTNQTTHLRRTDEGGGRAHYHNNKPDHLTHGIAFLFTCQSSQYCHSSGRRQLWLFHSHQQAAWLWGIQPLWDRRRMGSLRGVFGRRKFCLSSCPGCSWEVYSLPMKHEHSCLYSGPQGSPLL